MGARDVVESAVEMMETPAASSSAAAAGSSSSAGSGTAAGTDELIVKVATLAGTQTAAESTVLGHTKRGSADLDYLEEIVGLKLDVFLEKLEERMAALEAYGAEKIAALDERLAHAYHTLMAVKECGARIGSENLLGGSFRRGEAVVEILKRRCADAIAERASLPSQVTSGMEFLEERLCDLEKQCLATVVSVEEKIVDDAVALARSIETALKAARDRLLTYDELPAQWRENPYIIRGYRFCDHYSDCVLSMGQMHNETCNIWTHGFGFLMMLAVALYYYPTTPVFAQMTTKDKVVFGIFLVAALKCLLSSTIWHTFNSIGILDHKNRFACVDYTGISVLIACSILTTQYASFYCQPTTAMFYMATTSVFGVVGVMMAWSPWFDKPSSRGLRVLFFVCFALTGLLALLHASITRGAVNTLLFYLPVMKSLLCYLTGIFFYALLFPERFFPGSIFDWIFMSHNFWHIAVLGGIYYHYTATHKLFENAREFSCAAH
ncbi:hemolysin-III related-domain-containing protein [Limtongia smithiae]|uniref:hemolysin-III related-domain-containing protein n=1 Tax=Limtongia smithiae TaxID=1125753 RepID=UPI0034CF86E8